MAENKEEVKPIVKKEETKREYLVLENFTWDRQYVRSEKIELSDKEAKELLTNKLVK